MRTNPYPHPAGHDIHVPALRLSAVARGLGRRGPSRLACTVLQLRFGVRCKHVRYPRAGSSLASSGRTRPVEVSGPQIGGPDAQVGGCVRGHLRAIRLHSVPCRGSPGWCILPAACGCPGQEDIRATREGQLGQSRQVGHVNRDSHRVLGRNTQCRPDARGVGSCGAWADPCLY